MPAKLEARALHGQELWEDYVCGNWSRTPGQVGVSHMLYKVGWTLPGPTARNAFMPSQRLSFAEILPPTLDGRARRRSRFGYSWKEIPD